ncbi:MAG TPA: response regulator [Tepidisphaeraceae bacterium]|jgi:two-component system chemotaxis sensor kinase CheA|nr:response regulator [Tepidisphaeraceae bacterium]
MPAQDQEFIKKLQATFATEAHEHVQLISKLLLELEKSVSPAAEISVIENIYREAHSLKGASRAVDLSSIEKICQAMESVFAAWKKQSVSPSRRAFDALHKTLDGIGDLLASFAKKSGKKEGPWLDELVQSLDRLQWEEPSEEPAEKPAEAPKPAAGEAPSPPAGVERVLEQAAVPETVRISTAKLDSRLLQAEDMLAVKAMAVSRVAQLREITSSFEPWWKEWDKMAGDLRAMRREFEQKDLADGLAVRLGAMLHFLDWNLDYVRSMENKLNSLVGQTQQDRIGISRRVDDLLEDSKKLLMLPFSTITDMFPKIVRDLCSDQAKEAELVIQGGDVAMDKRILEEMKDALIHILRNCVDHGVEKPQDRKRLGKPARATITMAVCQVNGKIEIRVSDDGSGVDVNSVKKSAVSHGIVSAGEARDLSDHEAMSLIFHSGVSTSPLITEISGRGLGMAIVRTKAEKLGGKAAVESKPRAGTTLRITLPQTLATFRGIVVSAGGQTFIAPMASVERVLRLKTSEIKTVENRETILVDARAVSLARLEAVLELPRRSVGVEESASIPVVVMSSAEQRVAFAVDEVMREEEVLVKPLHKPLARLRNISGATVLGSGKAVPVLNVADLIKSARKHGIAPVPVVAAQAEASARSKKVLVVEDSITSRMLLKGILETANYQVRTAVDGIEGFTALREERFDLVVSDVEMPRMNGLDLTAKIRADKTLAELPVVLVTALESRQERERGIDVGANAYIIKSSFDQSNLLEVVRRFI